MSRSRKQLLGALTLWPAVYGLLFFIVWALSFIGIFGSMVTTVLLPDSAVGMFPGFAPFLFVCIFPLHLATMVDILAMTIYWAIYVYKDVRLVGDEKVLWMLIVLLGGTIGQAAHFLVRVWPEPQEGTGPQPAPA